MTEFRGNDYSTQISIINRVSLNYSPVPLLPTVMGCLLYLVGIFLIFFAVVIVQSVFKIPNKDLTNLQLFILGLSVFFSSIIIVFGLKKVFKFFFSKKVSLLEDKGVFTLKIDSKQIVFNKSEVVSVRTVRYYGKLRIISDGRMIIKLKNKNIRFSTDDNYAALVMMKKYLS